jgi:hypothetical protein
MTKAAVALGDGRGLSLVAGGEDQSSAVALGDGRGRQNGGGREDLSMEKDLFIHVQAPPFPSPG